MLDSSRGKTEQDAAGRVGQETRHTGDLAEGADEKKLVRKLDIHLIPLIMGLYLFSFLDRYVLPLP